MPDIFLSYSRDDLTTARRFADAFERAGFSVWWDQTLNPGEAFDEVTEKALHEAKAVVVLWSKKSVASRWVRAEATQANDSKTLVPVMIEACKRPIMFELTHTADLSNWKGNPDDAAWQAYLAGVKRVVGKDPVGAKLPATSLQASSPRRQFGMRTLIGVIAVLVVVGGGIWFASRSPKLVPAQAAKEVTLAVLPFTNLSDDPKQEYFSDGLTEEILDQLAQVKGLVVTGRTSSFSFKGKNEDLRVIAGKLGVANLLEGSIRKHGNKLKITAQLINGQSGAHLWSRTYEREEKDVFSVQEEIAKDVAKALSIALGAVEFSHAEGGTNVPEALEKFMQARVLSQQRRVGNSDQIVQLTREAVKLDPNFAMAWFMLADFLQPSRFDTPVDAAREMERSEAKKQIDATTPPNSGLAAFNRARRLLEARKWADSEPVVMQAYEAGPKYSRYLASNLYALFLQSVGRVREAVVASERLRQFDPLAMGASERLQEALDMAGRPDDAQVEYLRSKSLAGTHAGPEYLATIRLLLRPNMDVAAVRAQFQRLAANPETPSPLFGKLAGQLTDRKAIREALASTFADSSRQDAQSLQVIAQLSAAFGERDLALAAIRRSIDHGAPISVVWAQSKDSLHSDPGFKDLVRDMGLVEYWRSTGNWGDFCSPVGKDDFECH